MRRRSHTSVRVGRRAEHAPGGAAGGGEPPVLAGAYQIHVEHGRVKARPIGHHGERAPVGHAQRAPRPCTRLRRVCLGAHVFGAHVSHQPCRRQHHQSEWVENEGVASPRGQERRRKEAQHLAKERRRCAPWVTVAQCLAVWERERVCMETMRPQRPQRSGTRTHRSSHQERADDGRGMAGKVNFERRGGAPAQ